MSVAFLPSPARGLWHIGPVPVRADALCIVAGIAVGLWIAGRRYRRIGGRDGLILELSVVAVPAGLVGARLYSVLTEYSLYFGPGRDWVNVVRIWSGGLGLPGAMAGAAVAAWLYCRRTGVALGPIAGAAAPALAFAQAIGCWGAWFTQDLYGRPSALPWAVEIAPVHRVSDYGNYPTFQPLVAYESLWCVAVGLLLIVASRRLTGDRTFALYAALYAVGRLGIDALRIYRPAQALGIDVNQAVMLVVLAAALAYLYLTRRKKGPDIVAEAAHAPAEGGGAGAAAGVGLPGAASAGATAAGPDEPVHWQSAGPTGGPAPPR
jgi:prolipoprotein diacylglyceryl transferase